MRPASKNASFGILIPSRGDEDGEAARDQEGRWAFAKEALLTGTSSAP